MNTTVTLFFVYLLGSVLCFISWMLYFHIIMKGLTKRQLVFSSLSALFSYGGLLWSIVYWFLALADDKNKWGNKLF